MLALVGIGGAGKTAIADRFVRSLPGITEAELQLPHDVTLPVPDGLFVFSFYEAPNPEYFFDTLYDWLVSAFQLVDRRRVAPTHSAGIRMQASASLVIDALGLTQLRLLLVLDGLEKVQHDGWRTGVFGHIEDGGLRAFLGRAAGGILPGLAVMVSTRFELDDLRYEQERGTAPWFSSVSVEEISDTACITLLRHRGVRGGDDILRNIGRACGRHALTVDLVGGYLVHFYDGEPIAPLSLPTAEECQRLAAGQRDHRLRHVVEQTARFQRVTICYQAALEKSDAAALALLQRLCLFRLGADATMLTRIFTGDGKDTISGSALAALSPSEVQAKLNFLVEMRLIESSMRNVDRRKEYGRPGIPDPQAIIYTVHPAVREGFISSLDAAITQRGHEAVREGLIASLGGLPGKGTTPSDPATLDQLEEIIYHTLRTGQVAEAWDIYRNRIGSYRNLGLRLGALERGERICRAFADGRSPQAALRNGASSPPFQELSESQQAQLFNAWGLYLSDLGQLDAAADCYIRHNELCQGENASVGFRNLAQIWLLSGRLRAALRAAFTALKLAMRTGDTRGRVTSSAFCGYGLALRGEMDAALGAFRIARRWQHPFTSQKYPLYGLRGILLTRVLAYIGRYAEAKQLANANKQILVNLFGLQHQDIPKCNLILADLLGEQSTNEAARDLCQQAQAWALERDAKEVLCWSTLVQARIELNEVLSVVGSQNDQPAFQRSKEHIVACGRTLAEGLRIAREYGYGIYHIDLLLVQAHLSLLTGDAHAALTDAETALIAGYQPPPASGLPTLLAATDSQCGYAWGEAEGRHLRAEALLLHAAQHLGRADFVPATFDQLSVEVRRSIADAREELTRCQALRRKIQDPKIRQTEGLLNRLNGGELTRYPFKSPMWQETVQEEPPMLPAQPRPIFISYAHVDNEASDRKQRWLDRLLEFLKPLVRQEELTICSDRDIKIGQDWHQHLQAHLQGAKAAVLLVSPAFLASDYIVNNELPVLLKHARDRGVRILPIILSPCLFEETRFKYPDPKQGPEEFTLASLQAATLPSQTLIEMSEADQNRVLLALARRLLEIVKENHPR